MRLGLALPSRGAARTCAWCAGGKRRSWWVLGVSVCRTGGRGLCDYYFFGVRSGLPRRGGEAYLSRRTCWSDHPTRAGTRRSI